ncbi:MAG: 30S ribosomal protein S15 [Nitrosopumilaceae archaeon]|jgi:small subunit ribosomal protein S15|nr:30S ribosomal protein S15 [Nitrosopumilaceae archaeon]
MGRMHTHRHGKSHSRRPVEVRIPQWLAHTPRQVEDLVVRYAKEGLTPSQVGLKLRDQHAIPLVRSITGKTIGEILEQREMRPEMPEDLDNIVRKAVGLQRHLRENKGDRRNIRSLELIEAKVHRLSVYYKRIGRIPKSWKYKSVVAQLE